MEPNAFKDSIVEVLQNIAGAHLERFNRNWGLYYGNHFIGIIMNDSLFIRTNRLTRKHYIDLGMRPFNEKDRSLKRFYQVPGEILRNSNQLVECIHEAAAIHNTQPKMRPEY